MKNISQKIFMFIFYMVIGGIIGYWFAPIVIEEASNGMGGYIFSLCFELINIMLAMYIQLIIHETGHLIFGFVSGYKFSSFRIGSFMILKKQEKLTLKRYTLAGTGGQCLMIPPQQENMPFVLYNLGGALLNLISAALFYGLCLMTHSVYINLFFKSLIVMGIAIALLNGVPMKLNEVNNDGYNALSFQKNKKAMHVFFNSMIIQTQLIEGKRLRDMDSTLFPLPQKEDMQNSLTASLAAHYCARLMDQHHFEEAYTLMRDYIKEDNALVGVYKQTMTCDCVYCELILENRKEVVLELMDKSLKQFMKVMKKNPSVIYTQYALALLYENDKQKALKLKENFERIKKSYPFYSDIENAIELMERVDHIYQRNNSQ